MGHIISKSEIWDELRKRLDRHSTRLPRHAAIEKILALLFTEDEAELATFFPLATVFIEELVSKTGRKEAELKQLLDSMASKGLVMEIERENRTQYWLSAAFPGFFEYTFMRVQKDFPYHEMAKLLDDYFEQSDFAKEIANMETQRTRTLTRRDAIGDDLISEVLPYETARGLIEQVDYGSLETCYCRHKNVHLGKTCSQGAPVDDICMSFGVTADFLIKRGFARRADQSELLRTLDRAEEFGLVHIADNFRENVVFMCHCCGCCCELLKILTRTHIKHGIAPTRFVPSVDKQKCSGCGTCEERCQINAIKVGPEAIATIDEDWCIGCGVCVNFCTSDALCLHLRYESMAPPRNLRVMTLRILKERKDRESNS
jgi:formate hydrogenlyase subunit 6/NADH:ubiquinone oxidoreductase subunit I